MTIFEALTAAAAAKGPRPAVTWLDAASGERTELSFATLHNWVCKTANLLLDELDVDMGSEVAVHLPLHWAAPVVALASWAVGAAVTTKDAVPRVSWEGEEPVGDLVVGAGMGGHLTLPDAGGVLLVEALRQPDEFVDDPGDEGAWALDAVTQHMLLAEGRAEAVLLAGDRADLEVLAACGRTLPAGGRVVLARGFAGPDLDRVAAQERLA